VVSSSVIEDWIVRTVHIIRFELVAKNERHVRMMETFLNR